MLHSRRLMKKEVFIAILFGLVIGFVIVFGVVTARTALNKHQETVGQSADTPTPSPTAEASVPTTISITDPQDEAVVNSDTVTLRGTSPANANIVISSEKSTVMKTADSDGSFSLDLKLVSGVNEIRTTAFSQSGDRSDATITIVFSTADF